MGAVRCKISLMGHVPCCLWCLTFLKVKSLKEVILVQGEDVKMQDELHVLLKLTGIYL